VVAGGALTPSPLPEQLFGELGVVGERADAGFGVFAVVVVGRIDPDLSSAVLDVLKTHPDTYAEVLTEHFTRHLQALTAGM